MMSTLGSLWRCSIMGCDLDTSISFWVSSSKWWICVAHRFRRAGICRYLFYFPQISQSRYMPVSVLFPADSADFAEPVYAGICFVSRRFRRFRRAGICRYLFYFPQISQSRYMPVSVLFPADSAEPVYAGICFVYSASLHAPFHSARRTRYLLPFA